MFRTILLSLTIASAMLAPASARSGVAMHDDTPVIEVGEPFPHLSFPSLANGEPLSIADYRGKRVVLHVFASW